MMRGVILLVLVASSVAVAEDMPREIAALRFEQALGRQVPAQLKFRDDTGRHVRLEKYFQDKPVLLVLGYYRCPRLCSEVLKGLVDCLRRMTLVPGQDFEIVVVSIDPREGPALSRPRKEACLEAYGGNATAAGWHFLTGKEADIRALADAVGYRYVYDSSADVFNHAAGLILLTREGKVSRYFFGIDYPPSGVRLGLVEASENRIGTAVDQVVLFTCMAYDPETGKYLVSPMKLMRGAALLTVAILGVYLVRNWRRRDKVMAPTGMEGSGIAAPADVH